MVNVINHFLTWPTKSFYWLFGIFFKWRNKRKIWSFHNLSMVFLGQQQKYESKLYEFIFVFSCKTKLQLVNIDKHTFHGNMLNFILCMITFHTITFFPKSFFFSPSSFSNKYHFGINNFFLCSRYLCTLCI